MLWPLRVLAVFAIFLGWVGSPWIMGNLFHRFLATMAPAVEHAHTEGFNWSVAAISTLSAGAGLLLAAAMYYWRVLSPAVFKTALRPIYVASKHKFWFDELYRYTVVGGTVVLSRVVARFDLIVIDGIVNAVGWGTRVVVASLIRWFDLIVIDGALNAMAFVTGLVGEAGARLQSGRVQDYVAGLAIFAATVAAAVAAATLWFRIGMPWP